MKDLRLLKKAILQGKTDIFQVIELSKKLGYSQRLAPYFEVFFMIQTAEQIKLHIKKQAEEQGIHYNQMLTIIAYERAMVRLLQNKKLYNSFIFKGGIIMRIAYESDRYTSDLDASF